MVYRVLFILRRFSIISLIFILVFSCLLSCILVLQNLHYICPLLLSYECFCHFIAEWLSYRGSFQLGWCNFLLMLGLLFYLWLALLFHQNLSFTSSWCHISASFLVKTLGGLVFDLSHVRVPPYLKLGSSSSSASFSDNFISRGSGFSRSSISFSDNFIFLGTLLTLFSLWSSNKYSSVRLWVNSSPSCSCKSSNKYCSLSLSSSQSP